MENLGTQSGDLTHPAASKMHNILAGNPGPPTSPVTAIVVVIILILFTGGAFGVAALMGSSWHRNQSNARREALAEDATASWPVRVKKLEYLTFRGPGMNAAQLTLRGGFIEVTHIVSAARLLNSGEFCFPARETRIVMARGILGREELIIRGPSGGQSAHISISATSRSALHEIWNNLIAAGATPGY